MVAVVADAGAGARARSRRRCGGGAAPTRGDFCRFQKPCAACAAAPQAGVDVALRSSDVVTGSYGLELTDPVTVLSYKETRLKKQCFEPAEIPKPRLPLYRNDTGPQIMRAT